MRFLESKLVLNWKELVISALDIGVDRFLTLNFPTKVADLCSEQFFDDLVPGSQDLSSSCSWPRQKINLEHGLLIQPLDFV